MYDPAVVRLVREIIGRVADKWTMLVLEVLEEHGVVRFTRLGELVGGISQKMLTQTVRQMERDGLVMRTVYPVIPPKVDYRLTPLGRSLSAAFCGVWVWVEDHHDEIARARQAFGGRSGPPAAVPVQPSPGLRTTTPTTATPHTSTPGRRPPTAGSRSRLRPL